MHKLKTDTAEEEEVVNEGLIVELPDGINNEPVVPVDIMVAFEDENGVDGDGALGNALKQLERLEWNQEDLPFFFNRVEIRMGIAQVRKNYTKFQVLSEIIPSKVQDQVKSLLRKTENDFPNNDAYKQLKNQILKIFGPRPEASMERALNRVMSGTPSELARCLVNDMCKKELDCECCPSNVLAMWKKHLPSQVRAGIAHCTFNRQNFESMIELADKIYETQHVQGVAAYQVAAVGASGGGAAASLDETQPAIPYPEVAAIRGQRGGGRNRGRGGRRGGRGRGNQNSQSSSSGGRTGTKHPDLPAGDFSWCGMHFKHGKNAFFCSDPSSCPWKDVYTKKPAKQ